MHLCQKKIIARVGSQAPTRLSTRKATVYEKLKTEENYITHVKRFKTSEKKTSIDVNNIFAKLVNYIQIKGALNFKLIQA